MVRLSSPDVELIEAAPSAPVETNHVSVLTQQQRGLVFALLAPVGATVCGMDKCVLASGCPTDTSNQSTEVRDQVEVYVNARLSDPKLREQVMEILAAHDGIYKAVDNNPLVTKLDPEALADYHDRVRLLYATGQ